MESSGGSFQANLTEQQRPNESLSFAHDSQIEAAFYEDVLSQFRITVKGPKLSHSNDVLRITACDIAHDIDMLSPYFVVLWIHTPVCIIGLIGNIVSIVALCYDKSTSAISTLLQGVSVANVLVLVTSLMISVLPGLFCYLHVPSLILFNHSLHAYVRLRFLSDVAHIFLLYTAGSVTVLRYYAARQKGLHPTNSKFVWKLLATLFIFSVLINFPSTLEQNLQCKENSFSNATQPHAVEYFTLVANEFVTQPYYFFYRIAVVLLEILPVVAIFFAGTQLILILQKASGMRRALPDRLRKSSRSQSHEKSLLRSLYAVVTVLVICELPIAAVSVLDLLIDAGILASGQNDWLLLSRGVASTLLNANASSNLLIYLLSAKRFRVLLSRLLCTSCSPQTILRCSSASSVRRSRANTMNSAAVNPSSPAPAFDTTPTITVPKLSQVQYRRYNDSCRIQLLSIGKNSPHGSSEKQRLVAKSSLSELGNDMPIQVDADSSIHINSLFV